MQISGKLARAARALVGWPRDHVARLAGIDMPMLADFEAGRADPGDDAKARLRLVLEQGGAVFLSEDGEQGAGVRLKFTARDVRAINRMEGEGGPVGTDDV
ncbi:helix-turn-helix domain-containing protein [Sphingobium yanoikuyae]|uniref:DNA-binding protein n=1 Tax=Sphingobium yanoikuyae TaxID=13690 RepID=A0A291MZL9_SPHYA|nr:helix-turn-helix transcriptional regulator [Sphingobium yanoikuyae]ATI80395.1 DNA-binding protein [Sphingobium yanoikuyae]